MTAVVVVESPAKATTINKYLGNQYHVLASYGHIRDLPAKNGSVDPENGFAMAWELDGRGERQVREIERAVKGADEVILATDPDREGEAISWHVYNVLKERGLLDNRKVSRVVFNEITKSAILTAMQNPRDIHQPLVEAYLARRALDYLVGFTLSPILWRKLPGSRSAGRVQSVALRLVCERESEIEAFTAEEYWSVDSLLNTQQGDAVATRLVGLFGEKLDKMSLQNEAMATEAVQAIEQSTFTVASIEKKTVKRNPYPPFITSTLQQEASKKLGFSATRTMQTAQRLYEGIELGGETVGLITYMRTDGVTLSGEAIGNIRRLIEKEYGDNYLPSSPRAYKSKAKNAQEAHEAIRPTDVFRTPAQMKRYLNEDQYRLYNLIWKRTMACQMESAELDQMRVDFESPHSKGAITLRANGSVITFDGYLAVYRIPNSDTDAENEGKADLGDEDTVLPPMNEGDRMTLISVTPEQHFTKPPPRFTEASMVKTLEELGIGRPSTYASIIRILQERNYVRMESRRFVPEDRGRLVTTFLVSFFPKYVAYDFTAQLEDQLDEISDDRLNWQQVLKDFWVPFHEKIDSTKDLTITEVLDTLDAALEKRFFAPTEENPNPRHCPTCEEAKRDGGRLGLKLGRFGAFIGCINYPDCKYTRQLDANADGADAELAEGPKELGEDKDSGYKVYLCKGPYGFYVQLGLQDDMPMEAPRVTKSGKPSKAKPKQAKPKRSSLPQGLQPSDVTLEKALSLLTLPRTLGTHPETGESLSAGLGRFGPYVKMGDLFVSLKGDDDVLSIDLARAVEVIAASGKKIYNLGDHNKKKVVMQKGRFGYYLKYGKDKINLPKGTDPDTVTLEQAGELIDKKLTKGAMAGPAGKTSTKKTPAKKSARKKSTSKKTKK